jgi:hypothetical protein
MTLHRRYAATVALSLLSLLPLAACGPAGGGTVTPVQPPASGAPGPPAADPEPPKTKSKTKPKPGPAGKDTGTKAKTKTKTKAKTRPKALFGTQYAYLRSADLANRRLTFDLVQYFKDEAAIKACAEDRVGPTEGSRCVDYYIRNKNRKLRTLTVHPDAPLRLFREDGTMKPVDLRSFVATVKQPGAVFVFEVDANRIMKADEAWAP